MQEERTRTRLLRAIFALGIGTTLGAANAAERAPAPAPQETLVRIDAQLGVAIVRSPEGELRAWRVNEISRDGAWRLQRLLGDRIEVVAIGAVGGSARFWLHPGQGGARAVTSQPTDAEPNIVIETYPRSTGVTQ